MSEFHKESAENYKQSKKTSTLEPNCGGKRCTKICTQERMLKEDRRMTVAQKRVRFVRYYNLVALLAFSECNPGCKSAKPSTHKTVMLT